MGEPSSKQRIDLRNVGRGFGALSLEVTVDRRDCYLEQSGGTMDISNGTLTVALIPGDWLLFRMTDASAKIRYRGGTHFEVTENTNCILVFHDVHISDGKQWIKVEA